MIGTAVFYTADQELVADDTLCPRLQAVTVEQAAALCADHMVMWTPGVERFGQDWRVPSPDTRFFLRGVEIINPWSAFRPLEPYPVRLSNGQGQPVEPDPEPTPSFAVDDTAARLFGAS